MKIKHGVTINVELTQRIEDLKIELVEVGLLKGLKHPTTIALSQ